MIQKKEINHQKLFSLIVAIFIGLLIFDFYLFTAIGISCWIYSILLFIKKINNKIPVIELMLILCGYQWIFASYMSYQLNDMAYKMSVDEQTYMFNTVSMYLALFIGSLFFQKDINLNKEELLKGINSLPGTNYLLIILSVGVLNLFTKNLLPSSLYFLNHIGYSFMYIAGIMALYSKKYFIVFYVVFGFLLFKVIRSSVFNEFITWSFFILMFISNRYSFSKKKIILILLLAIFSLSVLQAIKPVYRDIISNKKVDNKVSLFVELLSTKMLSNILMNEEVKENDDLEELNSRANQGWVYALIYKHVPKKEPYARGETILEAIGDSFLPRFFFPNKKNTFNSEIFTRFTGRPLLDTTAMGLGIPGEAYANFGLGGAILFMFIYGFLIAKLTSYFNKQINVNWFYLFFAPIFFEMIIRGISNFSQVVNWQLKIIVVFLVFSRLTLKWSQSVVKLEN
ncbi:O-antigen polysaccharide polymerase Wzy [Vicingus serpentipes]|uniref:O-antigen polysaccharide polymerase Wzy n=1 Tax=Vicingus serpentipes TaxID=1926625 RepID=A0A5C6RP24_9FLAO|nr:O-antigen polysaccharide polymerase Wzy [Vicingus serpentipes]TXB63709.1 O-antigen polysaccharide polymerase Wzy [Vicingus serpentipes]